MMKGLELIHLCRKISAIPLSRGIHTDTVLFRRGVPRKIPDEPGIRRRRAAFQDEDITEHVEVEDDLADEVDIMNIDKAYDLNKSENAKSKARLERMIIANKFFASRPQPQMLTYNEKQCIRLLHKQDPVQWNYKTLSEAFPATSDAIKQVIKAKWKVTPERAKKMDSIVQKNWELLAEGKLNADPDVLEHLKKFLNRREILLDQIQNKEFYLPDVKKERVWNKGEFSGVLNRYERGVKKLLEKSEMGQGTKMLEDGTEKSVRTEEGKSSRDFVQTKIDREASQRSLENKDSFIFGEVTKFYSQHTTLEGLEDKILRRADAKKKLDAVDKVILDSKLGVKNQQNLENPPTESHPPPERIKQKIKGSSPTEVFMKSSRNDEIIMDRKENLKKEWTHESEVFTTGYIPPDERTVTTDETGIGKLLHNLQNPPQSKKGTARQKIVEEKPKIDFSDPERIRRENIYYDNEVRDIEDTAFWNAGRSSKAKALAEYQKRPHEGPDGVDKGDNPASTAYLSQDAYPERIKIPKNKQRSGATYKVKDCYYDDDGEFLYRVPGMSK